MAKDIVVHVPNGCDYYRPIALGLSGGRDSMALAYAMKSAGVNFFAVNFEHGIRGESSVKDSEFVQSWCKQNDVMCYRVNLDTPAYATERKLTVEQAGRELRYRYFDALIRKGACSLVALAHHRDDQVETIFMRILRGTGVRGLAAMSELSGSYFRPLLSYSREDINAYVEKHAIPFVEDETNADTAYGRNFIREELKRIRERYPAADEAFVRLSRNAAEAEEVIESQISAPPVLENGEVTVNIASLASKQDAVRKTYILKACELLGVRQDVEERHYPLIFSLANSENGKMVELPHGLEAHRDGKNIVFTRKSEAGYIAETPFCGESVDGVVECVPAHVICEYCDGSLFIDRDKLPAGAVLRNRRQGDWFKKFGCGTKSLGDFLTDKKIPLRKRDRLVVCAAAPEGEEGEHEILFVVGLEITKRLETDENTENMLRIIPVTP